MEMKVFISSTSVDLLKYRQAAIDVVLRYECKPLAMEYFGSQPEEPTTVCEKEIRECDVFIGIYAHRYGFVPEGKEKSITQLEYELAKELGKDCLCFIVKKDFPWNPEFWEIDKYPKLKEFLEKVKKDNVVEFFTSPDDFAKKLSTSLARLMEKKKGTAVQKEGICIIPTAPAPYIAHPYPLPDHFTGRDAERASLSNWFFNEKEPVFVMEAIGGMGKSALTWVWLQQDVLERAVEIDGVFWWSFYDEPFDSFIQHLACYVMGKEDQQGVDLPMLMAILQQKKFLLVLDGLERVLRGYAGMEAMFIQEKRFEGNPEKESEWDRQLREPVHPQAGRFLQRLYVGNSRTLITSRLMPVPLEGLFGVKYVFLKGLSKGDAVRFFRGEGVKGTRAELEQAGKVYDYHPLMLKLLTTSIRRSRAKDIKGAFRLKLIDKEEPHKILTRGYKLLSKEEQQVVSRIAVLRSVFTFDSAKALFPKMDEEQLWQVMQELRNLGFLFYDEKQDRFDFHPIMHAFLYNNLTDRAEVHDLAVRYFQAIPKVKKIITLEDLAPVIELYHHLVKAGKFDEAFELFRDRIHDQCYYQLSAYHLIIELLKELFPNGEDKPPQLEKESDQGWALNTLSNTYSLSGQPVKAVPLYLLAVKIPEKDGDKENLAIGLENVASMAQIHVGQLSATTAHLQKGIVLCREIEDEFNEALGHSGLGQVMAYQGRVKGDSTSTEDELNKAFESFHKEKNINWLGIVSTFRSLSTLLQARLAAVLPAEERHSTSHSLEALEQARKAMAFAEKSAKKSYPLPRDFVQTYWLLGEALIQCRLSTAIRMKSFNIHFYDDYFQQQIESVSVQKGNELTAAERCLNEGLRRCRKVNLVEFEPDLLLALARLEKAKRLPPDEKILKEVQDICLRSGFRLQLADLHLFCGHTLMELKEPQKLLGLNAIEHLEKTKKYALDVSEFSHLYQSKDPQFYHNIPEYEMLKRGMSQEERIKNGYWVAYRIAEVLEEKKIGKPF
jgi:tetratricopeptide (TPR) repeat protein